MTSQSSLGWTENLWGITPKWTVEPQVEIINSLVQQKLADYQCTATFFSQGAFNKLYTITCDNRDLLMRVALPVDPYFKTFSEISTLEFVRTNTDIPVPRVHYYATTHDNQLGFEWILMQRMPGKPLSYYWRQLSMDAKEQLAKTLALYVSQLWSHQFDSIGNIYCRNSNREEAEMTDKAIVHVDRIVSMPFFWGDRLHDDDVPRGPYHSDKDWLHARLTLQKNYYERALKRCDDDDEIEDIESYLGVIGRLWNQFGSIFAELDGYKKETDETVCRSATVLFHDDLSSQNILVNEDGTISAIVDWECVSVLPLWKSCDFPSVFKGRSRSSEPLKENYTIEEDGQVNELYWEHLMEFEKTQLRQVFTEEMRKKESSWLCLRSSRVCQVLRNIELAICICDNELSTRMLNEWLDEIEADGIFDAFNLEERFDAG